MGEVVINEEWRSISGYLNHQVSNIGRVRHFGEFAKPNVIEHNESQM